MIPILATSEASQPRASQTLASLSIGGLALATPCHQAPPQPCDLESEALAPTMNTQWSVFSGELEGVSAQGCGPWRRSRKDAWAVKVGALSTFLFFVAVQPFGTASLAFQAFALALGRWREASFFAFRTIFKKRESF